MVEANNDTLLMERIKTLVKEGKIEESGRVCASYLNQTTSENFLTRLENIIEALSAIVGGKNVIKFLIKNLVIDIPSLLENLSKKDSVLRYSFLFLLKSVCEEEIDLFLPYSVDLLNSTDPNVREADLQLLIFMAGGQKKIENTTILKTLAKKLSDEKDFVVQKAIQALKAIGKNSPNVVTSIIKEYSKEVPENENVKKAIDSIFKSLVSVDTVKEIDVKKVEAAPIKKEIEVKKVEEAPIKKEIEAKKVEEAPMKKEIEVKKVEEAPMKKEIEVKRVEEINKLYIETIEQINQLKSKEIELKNKEFALKEKAFKLKQDTVGLGLRPEDFTIEFVPKKDISYPPIPADMKIRAPEIPDIETALKQREIELKKKELEIDELALKLKKTALEVELKPNPQTKEVKSNESVSREKIAPIVHPLEIEAVDIEKETKNKELELKKKQLEEKEKELQERELQEKEKSLMLKEALLEQDSKLHELSKVELEIKKKSVEEKEKKNMEDEAKRIERKNKEAEEK